MAGLLGQGGLPAGIAGKALDAYRAGTRPIARVSLVAEVFDTNEGYGKPTFVNGIHVGDLAAIGGEGKGNLKKNNLSLYTNAEVILSDSPGNKLKVRAPTERKSE